ncbi:malignant fibrous histiocytoma-amplified sequence 1 [Syngnathus typhle]|uniref:malignant fibrous histiocytoma-amplified sequence 1 n=1 Tax=Syngnathus typhle TaxID=161592 RepID=UPI002A6AD637|nr:malignant fibrous histiocytoma-amplified sequence 1 [Syngnathus typhle]
MKTPNETNKQRGEEAEQTPSPLESNVKAAQLWRDAALRSRKLRNDLRQLPPEPKDAAAATADLAADLAHVEALNLGNSLLQELPEGLASSLGNLRVLVLRRNRFSSVPCAVFELRQLVELDLSHNRLQAVAEGLCRLSRLKKLSVSHNSIQRLPERMAALERLEELDVSFNQLCDMPASLRGLARLRTLDVDHNKLSRFPPEILTLGDLEELDCSGNQFEALPEDVVKLKSIKILWLSSLRLKSLPHTLCHLQNLESLMLDGNRLTTLPHAFGGLRTLRMVNLSSNQLTDFPGALLDILGLEELYLSRNKLTRVPEEIGRLQNLVNLWLDNNDIAYLPASLVDLVDLEELVLQGNQIAVLPDHFGRLSKVNIWKVKDNPLVRPPYEVCMKGIPHIAAYQRDAARSQVQARPRLKVVLVGRKDAGKTRLRRCLLNESQRESRLLGETQRETRRGTQRESQRDSQHESQRESQLSQSQRECQLSQSQRECQLSQSQRECQLSRSQRESQLSQSQRESQLSQSQRESQLSQSLLLSDSESQLSDSEGVHASQGIQVSTWAAEGGPAFLVYDLSGKPELDPLKAFFLSPSALYILVVNLQAYSPCSFYSHVGYFLHLLGAKVPQAVVLLVGTHADLCGEAELEEKKLDVHRQVGLQQRRDIQVLAGSALKVEQALQQGYAARASCPHSPFYAVSDSNLRRKKAGLRALLDRRLQILSPLLSVSCGAPGGEQTDIWRLCRKLTSVARHPDIFPELYRPPPGSWRTLEELLRRSPQFWLTRRDSARLGQQAGLTGEERLQSALSYLHRSGALLHLEDSPALKDYVFHKPPRLLAILNVFFQRDGTGTAAAAGTRPPDEDGEKLQRHLDAFRSHGLLPSSAIPWLLRPLVQTQRDVDAVLELLDKMGVCYCVNKARGGKPPKGTTELWYKFPGYVHRGDGSPESPPRGAFGTEPGGGSPESPTRGAFETEAGGGSPESPPPGAFETEAGGGSTESPPRGAFETKLGGGSSEPDGGQAPPGPPFAAERLQIRYSFPFLLPPGIFARLAARIDRHVVRRWDGRRCVLAYRGKVPVVISHRPAPPQAHTLSISSRAALPNMWTAWQAVTPLLRELDALLEDWPGLHYHKHILCAKCLRRGSASPHAFPGELLSQRRPEGVSELTCPKNSSERVNVALVYPPAPTDIGPE